MTRPRKPGPVKIPPDPNASAATRAARDFAQLREQAAKTRALLTRLQRDVVAAESRLGSSQGAQLLEANEQLLLATLRAQTDAEATERTLREVARSAELDALTELPKRALLLDRFAQAIANAKRHHTRLALLFLDLNGFKQINDTLGHAVGDQVLKLAARCLTSSVREADTVSRHGGDEFVILLAEVSQASDAVLIADKLLAALGAPNRVGTHVLPLTASIGISIYPDDGADADTLIERADAAMYRAKRHDRGSFIFHGETPAGERSLEGAVLKSPPRPPTDYERALAEQQRRHVQLREANEQLVLAALDARQLQAAAEQVQRHQAEFLAVLAHELRNPLAPIRNAAAALGQVNTDEPLLPWVQTVIERQVTQLSRLLDDLLDIARVNTGKLRLERRWLDMADIVDEAVEACRPAMDAHLQHFELQRPERALELYGDPVRLAQIVRNLLDNASKYTPDGGDITLALTVVDAAVVLTVSDNGIGIAAEVLPHVFEPFVQDPRAIGFNGVGLGIGLTVVRELVEAHGGIVVASSAGGGFGSQFVVTLPLAAPAIDP